MGETEQALAEFDRLAAQRPESYEPLSRKGDLLRSEERFEEAVEAYDGAVERLERQGEIGPHHWRSEEHTSELQSLMRISYAVFCLKKQTKKPMSSQKTTYDTT